MIMTVTVGYWLGWTSYLPVTEIPDHQPQSFVTGAGRNQLSVGPLHHNQEDGRLVDDSARRSAGESVQSG